MNIINFGSFIDKGVYTLHSSFRNVQNYSNKHDLISLVKTSVGSGPNNIVLSEIPPKPLNSIVIGSSEINFETSKLSFKLDKSNQENDIYVDDSELLLARTESLIGNISAWVANNSLAFLLYPELESNFKSSFERAFLKHVKLVTVDFDINNLPEIALKMKGVGFGLTPSGDDFNCGVLYALNYLNKIIDLQLKEIIEQVYNNSLGKNLISNTFLKYSYLNEYYEKFYNLLKAIKNGSESDMLSCTIKVIQSGHSSGSDMLTGFLLTLRGVLSERSSE